MSSTVSLTIEHFLIHVIYLNVVEKQGYGRMSMTESGYCEIFQDYSIKVNLSSGGNGSAESQLQSELYPNSCPQMGYQPIRSQCTLSLPPENRRPYGFLMVSEVRERVYWERMG